MADIIQIRRDTAANWTSVNPTLADAEIGYEKDTRRIKIGNGTSTWTALPYSCEGVSWGSIVGTLEDQTDLVTALRDYYNLGYDESVEESGEVVFGYFAGLVRNDNEVYTIDAGYVVLEGGETNYIEVDMTEDSFGAVNVVTNITGFTSGNIPLYVVVVDSIDTLYITDKRTGLSLSGSTDLSGYMKLNQSSSQTIINGQPIQNTLTADELVATDSNKKFVSLPVDTYPSKIELAYLKGVTSAIQTQFTGKKNKPNQVSIESSATPTPSGNYQENEHYTSALAVAAEFQTPSGSPANGNTLVIAILDAGVAKALTYVADYYGFAVDLPSTTIAGKIMIQNYVYLEMNSKWNLLSVINEQ